MDNFVAHANIDHYLDLLNSSDLPTTRRAVVMKLLAEEEEKLGHSLEQLQFAEDRTVRSQIRMDRLRQLRDGFADGSTERAKADKLLANFEATYRLMEQFCEHMRKRVNSRGI